MKQNFLIISFLLLTSFCFGQTSQTDIYVAGYFKNSEGANYNLLFLKNGKEVLSPDDLYNKGNYPQNPSQQLFVLGNDSYLLSDGGNGVNAIKVFKNGKELIFNFMKTEKENLSYGGPYSIAACGNNIYINLVPHPSYSRSEQQKNKKVSYLKNGQEVSYAESTDIVKEINGLGKDKAFAMVYPTFALSDGIYHIGSPGLYVTRYDGDFVFYKNGIQMKYVLDIGSEFKSQQGLKGGFNIKDFSSTSGDIYLSGVKNYLDKEQKTVVYWKNGKEVALFTYNTADFLLGDVKIFASGKDVYVAVAKTNRKINKIEIYKNGQEVESLRFESPSNEDFKMCFITDLTVVDDNIYVSGSNNDKPVYWKNGKENVISNKSGTINKIVVVKAGSIAKCETGIVGNATNIQAEDKVQIIDKQEVVVPKTKYEKTAEVIAVATDILIQMQANSDARREKKAEKEKAEWEENKRAEEQKNNDIINNKDYYIKITSKGDNEMGQYCDYMVKKFHQAGYAYAGVLNQSVASEKKDKFEYASKSINIGFKNEKDTLYFTIRNTFSLGEGVGSFTRGGWVISRTLPQKEVMAIVKNIFESDIKAEEGTIVKNYFEFVINPQAVANNIKDYDFSLTNYKGFSSEINKLSDGETVKDYLVNGFKYYGNLASGDENDFKQAIFWFTKAAEASNSKAMQMLSSVYFKKNDYKMAEQWAVKAREAGEQSAYRVLGANYSLKGKDSDAVYWYKKAIDLNDPEAYYLLAVLYMYKTGVYSDEKEGERLYLIGAEKGSSNCMSSLITLYLYGSSSGIIKKDKSKTKFWQNKLRIADPKLYESLKMYW